MIRIQKKAKKSTKQPSAAERAALRRATGEIRRHQRSIATGFHRIGTLLNEVHERELWRAGGHRTFDAYLKNEGGFGKSPRSAYKYMRIARTFGEKEAVELGPEKIGLMFAYVDATRDDAKDEAIPGMTIPVRTADGKVVKKNLADVTSRELARATTDVNARKQEKALRELPGANEADRLVELGSEALDRAQLESTKIVIVRGEGEPKVSVHNVRIPNASRTFAILGKALRKL